MGYYKPIAALDPTIPRELEKVKMALFKMKTQGFLSATLCRLKEIVWTDEIDTAAVSPTVLYWNPDFFLQSSPKRRLATLAHELWHIALLHSNRLAKRNPLVWNYAADYVINLMLDRDGFDFDGFPRLFDNAFKDMSTEQVYELLVSNAPNMSLMIDGIGVDLLEPESQAEAIEAVTNTIAASITAGAPSEGQGSLPGELTIVIDGQTNPKLPFSVILANHFNTLTNDEYSYARPSRRYDDPVLPGNTGRNGLDHLLYCIDISGSISDEDIVAVNAELKNIQENLRPERMTVITWDTVIHDTYEFERDDEFHDLEITGRGGTHLGEVYAYLQEHQPTVAVIFTDLDVGIPPNPGIPIIWICTDHSIKSVPYGVLIHTDHTA